MGKPEQEKPAQLNIQESITEKSITDISNIHQSIYPASGGTPDGNTEMDRDRIDRIDTYREIIKENIEFEALVHRYGYERVDELVELMLQTVLSQRPYIRIAGDEFPREVVKSRFLKVNFSHVEYVFDCLDNNTTKVRNIKSYLLAALYNAPGYHGQLLPGRSQSRSLRLKGGCIYGPKETDARYMLPGGRKSVLKPKKCIAR